MLCLSGFELYSRWVPLTKSLRWNRKSLIHIITFFISLATIMVCCFSNNGKVQWSAFSKYVACSVIITFNPFTPGNVAQNCFLKLIKLFSGHCLATKSQNAVCELRTSQSLLFQMQCISFQHLIMLRKQNFKLVFRFKSETAVLTFIFRFLSSHW